MRSHPDILPRAACSIADLTRRGKAAYTLLVTFPILPPRPPDGSSRKLTKRRAGEPEKKKPKAKPEEG
jgi:hypothetical protein